MSIPLPIIGQLIGGIGSYFTRRSEQKHDLKRAELKLDQRRESHDQVIELTDAEARALAQKNKPATWIDEYLTVVVTSPYPLLIVACIWLPFTGDDRLLVGVKSAIHELNNLGDGLAGYLLGAAVCVGLGIKIRAR